MTIAKKTLETRAIGDSQRHSLGLGLGAGLGLRPSIRVKHWIQHLCL